MKERPILFNGDMVRAILDGRKTQTRRPMKEQPHEGSKFHGMVQCFGELRALFWCEGQPSNYGTPLPMHVGDRLWVRETTCIAPRRFAEPDETCVTDSGGFKRYVSYKADRHSEDAMRDYNLKWSPSIHVPRWASRIDLEITRVWVERVQDITPEDCRSEGIHVARCGCEVCARGSSICTADAGVYVEAFRDLWQSIYGTWDANPFVWAYEFRMINQK